MSANDAPDFEAVTTERSRPGTGVIGNNEIPEEPRTTVIDARESATFEPSASTDEEAVEQFLAETDFEAAFLVAIEVPVPNTRCYTVAVESVSVGEDEGEVTIDATIEREHLECLDQPTVLTSFVRVQRQPAPAAASLELDDGVLDGGS